MSLPEELRFEEGLLPSVKAESVLDTLAMATDVLDLLRRADQITPPEIDLWAALTVGDEPKLYVHAPRHPSPAFAIGLAESMSGELQACTGKDCKSALLSREAQMSCAHMDDTLLNDLSNAWRDHVTQRGEKVVGLSRAAATDDRALTLDCWRQADEALEVTAWMLGALADRKPNEVGVVDPITGLHTRAFFEEMLRHELDRQGRGASELSIALLQVRNSSPLLADMPVSPSVLAAAGAAIKRTLRRSDVIGRLDARTMAVMLPGTGPRKGLIAATRLGESLRDSGVLEGWSVDVGVSGLGIDLIEAHELMGQARHAMTTAEKGRAETPFVYL
jgi:diguanylate cyclase (GGDEF)-like protein